MRKHPKAFYDYGEGSISHSPDRPCELFHGIHHPTISRTEYPSIWHYRAERLMYWLWNHFQLMRFIKIKGTTFEWGLWGLGGWLFHQAHRSDYPHIYVEFDPKDSIRDTDWADWDVRTQKMWDEKMLDKLSDKG